MSVFYEKCAKFSKIGKYPLALFGNMDEMPIFFDMVPNSSFAKKGSKLVTVRTSGCEKKHVVIVITIAACGDILPPMIIFPGKSDHSINLTVRDNLCIVTQEKTWIDEHLMIVWYEKKKKKWLRYVCKTTKETGFHKSLMVMHVYCKSPCRVYIQSTVLRRTYQQTFKIYHKEMLEVSK